MAAAVMSRHDALTGRVELGTALVVVDDPDGGNLLHEILGRAGMATIGLSRGAEVLDAVRRESPVLVVLDVCLPDVNGYEVCRSLRNEFGDGLAVILMSGERVGPLDRTAGLMLGADDYVVIPFDHDELVARVRRLAQRSRSANGTPAARTSDLTPRELEILRKLALGRRPREIAQELVVSPKTVSNHMQKIFTKLGVHSQSQAVAFAFQEGLVETDVQAHWHELAPLLAS